MSHDPLIISIFGAQDMTYFLSVLKTVVLLNIFVETIILFLQDSLMNRN